jgi:hypothetical protein
VKHRVFVLGVSAEVAPPQTDDLAAPQPSGSRKGERQLEEDAGKNLYDFLNLRGKIDARLFQRWAWYFATKLWFSHARTEFLSDGGLRPVLTKLAKPEVAVGMPIHLARLDASERTWQYASRIRGWAGDDSPFMFWVMRGLVILVVADPGPTIVLPIPSTQLREGLRLQDIQVIRPRYVKNLVDAPPVTIEEMKLRRPATVTS